MIEPFPLERAAEAYEHMMSGKARFRAVLTVGEQLKQRSVFYGLEKIMSTPHRTIRNYRLDSANEARR